MLLELNINLEPTMYDECPDIIERFENFRCSLLAILCDDEAAEILSNAIHDQKRITIKEQCFTFENITGTFTVPEKSHSILWDIRKEDRMAILEHLINIPIYPVVIEIQKF